MPSRSIWIGSWTPAFFLPRSASLPFPPVACACSPAVGRNRCVKRGAVRTPIGLVAVIRLFGVVDVVVIRLVVKLVAVRAVVIQLPAVFIVLIRPIVVAGPEVLVIEVRPGRERIRQVRLQRDHVRPHSPRKSEIEVQSVVDRVKLPMAQKVQIATFRIKCRAHIVQHRARNRVAAS